LAKRRVKARAGVYDVVGNGMVKKVSIVKLGDLPVE
jgi:hypothetical protein